MKNLLIILKRLLITTVVCALLSTPTFALTEPFTYTDSETGVSFTVPENWTQTEMSQPRQYLDAKFVADDNSGVTILYGATDIWSEMSPADRADCPRSMCNNSMLSTADIASSYGVAEDEVEMVSFGETEYFKFVNHVEQTVSGIFIEFDMTVLSFYDNGWLFQFQFSGGLYGEQYDDFLSLMNSVSYPDASTAYVDESDPYYDEPIYDYDGEAFSQDEINGLLEGIVLSLFITVLVYTVPILIYRFAIRKCPVKPKKAKKITIIFAVVGFVVISAIASMLGGEATIGGGTFLWSFINYKILSAGYSEKQNDEFYESSPVLSADDKAPLIKDSTASTANQDDVVCPQETVEPVIEKASPSAEGETDSYPQVLFCRRCGTKLIKNSNYCNKCGSKIED